jgi:hypothetical protein
MHSFLCQDVDNDLILNIAAQIAAKGFRIEKKLNKMSKGRSRIWFKKREQLIKTILSNKIMFFINSRCDDKSCIKCRD